MKSDANSPSVIEKAKVLKGIKAITDKGNYDQVLEILTAGDQSDRIVQAIAGLTEEDEFLLLCLLMGTTTHITPLEQKSSIAVGNAAPDLLVRFQPGYARKGLPASKHRGYRCFVEVKSTKNDKFRISGSALQKLRGFADIFGLPLIFAVRFLLLHGLALWVIVEDTDRSRKPLVITLPDWTQGLRPILWDEYSYMLIPGTYFQATYGPNITGNNVCHSEYGEQTTFQVVTKKGRFPFSGDDAFFSSLFFEPYGLEEVESKREGILIHVTYRARNFMLSVADLIFGINRLPRDEDGRLIYDASRILRELADKHKPALAGRALIEYLGNKFCDMGALGIGGYGETEEGYHKWIATGGQQVDGGAEPSM